MGEEHTRYNEATENPTSDRHSSRRQLQRTEYDTSVCSRTSL